VLFDPVDYVVFKGMNVDKMKGIVLLDRARRGIVQTSIRAAVEHGRCEWQTIRISPDGKFEIE
jgi:predicted Holliday junction resolvase-like endonuclease